MTEVAGTVAGLSADAEFDAFVRGNVAALARFGRLLTTDDARAQDVVQEALARCYLRWRRAGAPDDPLAYVRRAMVNVHANWWRRLLSRERPGAVPDTAGDAPDRHGETDLRLTVWTALSALPPRQRAVVVLRYYEGLTEPETAAVLGCAVGTVKSQTAKALGKLRVDASLAATQLTGEPSS